MAGPVGCRPPQADGETSRMSGWLRCPARACAWSIEITDVPLDSKAQHMFPSRVEVVELKFRTSREASDPTERHVLPAPGCNSSFALGGSHFSRNSASGVSTSWTCLLVLAPSLARVHCNDQQGLLPVFLFAFLLGANQLHESKSSPSIWPHFQSAVVARPHVLHGIWAYVGF